MFSRCGVGGAREEGDCSRKEVVEELRDLGMR